MRMKMTKYTPSCTHMSQTGQACSLLLYRIGHMDPDRWTLGSPCGPPDRCLRASLIHRFFSSQVAHVCMVWRPGQLAPCKFPCPGDSAGRALEQVAPSEAAEPGVLKWRQF